MSYNPTHFKAMIGGGQATVVQINALAPVV